MVQQLKEKKSMNIKSSYDRFDLEQVIMELAQVETDVALLNTFLLESNQMDIDSVSNALLGIEVFTKIRLEKAMTILEAGLRDGWIR